MHQIKSLETFMRSYVFIVIAGTAHSRLEQNSMTQMTFQKPDRNMVFKRRVGDNVMLPCSVTDPENTVIEWSKSRGNEETKLFSGPLRQTRDMRYNLNPNNYTLTIDNLNLNDSGKFLCEILEEKVERIEHVLEVVDVPVPVQDSYTLYIVLAVFFAAIICAAIVGAVLFIRQRKVRYQPANPPMVAFTKK